MTSPILASNAYAAIAKIATGAGAPAGAAPGGAVSSFGDVLKSAVAELGRTTQAADSSMTSMATGKANVVDVVTAVAETEVAIEALVSIRDRVIQSYEEIMRMPI
jgi:flagellar hook-basal body complex protein FliE